RSVQGQERDESRARMSLASCPASEDFLPKMIALVRKTALAVPRPTVSHKRRGETDVFSASGGDERTGALSSGGVRVGPGAGSGTIPDVTVCGGAGLLSFAVETVPAVRSRSAVCL